VTKRVAATIAALAIVAVAGPGAAADDAAYCRTLTDLYRHYLGGSGTGTHTDIDHNARARLAIDGCAAGNYSGIPVLEELLRNARIEPPARSGG